MTRFHKKKGWHQRKHGEKVALAQLVLYRDRENGRKFHVLWKRSNQTI